MEIVSQIHDKGSSFFLFPYKVYHLAHQDSDRSEDYLIVSVPKKIFKRAVKRNLIRRRIKESFRLNKDNYPGLKGKDILIVYTYSEILDYGKITDSLKKALEKIS